MSKLRAHSKHTLQLFNCSDALRCQGNLFFLPSTLCFFSACISRWEPSRCLLWNFRGDSSGDKKKSGGDADSGQKSQGLSGGDSCVIQSMKPGPSQNCEWFALAWVRWILGNIRWCHQSSACKIMQVVLKFANVCCLQFSAGPILGAYTISDIKHKFMMLDTTLDFTLVILYIDLYNIYIYTTVEYSFNSFFALPSNLRETCRKHQATCERVHICCTQACHLDNCRDAKQSLQQLRNGDGILSRAFSSVSQCPSPPVQG